MEITFNRSALVNAFKKMSSIVRSDLLNTDASSYVGFVRKGDKCSLVGTDNAASISVDVEATMDDCFTGPVMLPFGVMSKVLAKCVSDDVSFSLDGCKSDEKEWVNVLMVAGKCKTKLPSMPLSQVVKPRFSIEGMTEVEIAASELLAGIDKTSVAISEDTISRPELRGTLFEKKKCEVSMSFVTTNGYQMSWYSVDLDSASADSDFRSTFPAKYVGAIVKLLDGTEGDVKLAVSDDKISIVASEFAFTTVVNGGAFPDWRRIVPKTDDYEAKFTKSATELLEAIERVGSVVNDTHGSFAMGALNGLFHLSAVVSGSELHITDDLPLCYGGNDVFFACNQKFFIRVLKKTSGGDVQMFMGHTIVGSDDGSFRPIMIFDGKYNNLILPLRGKPTHS